MMKYINQLASLFGIAALGMMTLTSCEGSDLYNLSAPEWLSGMGGNEEEVEEEELVGQMEDVYGIGNEDLSSGFWTLGKTYVVPAGQKWQAQFDLTVNPDNKYFKNFYLVLNAYNEGLGDEFGVIRYDNDPTKNSEWNTVGAEIDRSLIDGNFSNSSGSDETDASVQKMNGRVTITVDRADGGLFIKMSNGTLVKTYTQTTPFPSTGADGDIACRIGVEGSYVSFVSTNIEPIGGCTSANDKQPLSMTLSGVPTEVLVGTDFAEAMANVTATVTFEEGVTKDVTAEELQLEAIPNFEEPGQKTLIAIYNKTFKGVNCDKPIIASKSFAVVSELSAFTQTVVVPSPIAIGAANFSTGFWGEHTGNITIEPKETKVTSFTNYSSGVSNWNNFLIVLCKADNTEYAVLRADNFGWGSGYEGFCTPSMEADRVWEEWLPAMNGAKVTTYVTNNGDGTADVKAVMVGNNDKTYTQFYKGIKVSDPDNFYFRFTVDGSRLVFDRTIGASNNSTGFWGAHSANVQVISHQVSTINFTNYSSGVSNWNNFLIVLCKADNTEYAVLRADNFGWGDGYGACTPSMEAGRTWEEWLPAMNGAKVTAQVFNHGNGKADVKIVMVGNNGKSYTQDYIGVSIGDPDDFYYRLSVDGCHLVLE